MQSKNKLITQAEIKDTFGGVSDMTIWRWLQDPKMGFPKPIKIKTRNYWKSIDVDTWLTVQVGV